MDSNRSESRTIVEENGKAIACEKTGLTYWVTRVTDGDIFTFGEATIFVNRETDGKRIKLTFRLPKHIRVIKTNRKDVAV